MMVKHSVLAPNRNWVLVFSSTSRLLIKALIFLARWVTFAMLKGFCYCQPEDPRTMGFCSIAVKILKKAFVKVTIHNVLANDDRLTTNQGQH